MSFGRQKAKKILGTFPTQPPPGPCHRPTRGLTAPPPDPQLLFALRAFHAHIIWVPLMSTFFLY